MTMSVNARPIGSKLTNPLGLIALGAVLGLLAMPASGQAETMRDRCSASVSIPVHSYNGGPLDAGSVVLERKSSGYSNWSQPFTVKRGSSGHIRWWCHSTRGNIFDLGTHRPKFNFVKVATCTVGAVSTILGGNSSNLSSCKGILKSWGTSAVNGWTPERSRCGNRSDYIRARLAPDRLLQIQCLRR